MVSVGLDARPLVSPQVQVVGEQGPPAWAPHFGIEVLREGKVGVLALLVGALAWSSEV